MLVGGTGGKWFMGIDRWLRWLLLSPFLRLTVRPLVHKDSRADLLTITDLIEAGKITPVLDRTYPLASVPEAIQCVREGRARGQVVIAVGGSTPDAPTAARWSAPVRRGEGGTVRRPAER